jgi:hypothetical protein
VRGVLGHHRPRKDRHRVSYQSDVGQVVRLDLARNGFEEVRDGHRTEVLRISTSSGKIDRNVSSGEQTLYTQR